MNELYHNMAAQTEFVTVIVGFKRMCSELEKHRLLPALPLKPAFVRAQCVFEKLMTLNLNAFVLSYYAYICMWCRNVEEADNTEGR